jgi:ATP-dependent protease ClpP protease subunit
VTSKKMIDELAAADAGWWFNGKQAVELGFADGFTE